MKNLSIRKKLMLAVGGTILVLLALSSAFSYQQARASLAGEISERIRVTGEKTATFVSHWLKTKSTVVAAAVNSLNTNLSAGDIVTQGQRGGNFLFLYLGTQQGEMTMRPDEELPADYDPRIRPWYKQARQQGKQIVTAPYVDASTGELVITFAQPTDNGVLAGDVALTAVVNQVLDIDLGEHGYAALLDAKQQFMVHPDKALIGKPISQFLSAAQLQPGAIVTADFNQHHSLLGLYPIAGSDWQVLLVTPEKEAYASLAALRWSSWVTGILTIVIVTLISGVIISRLLKPLANLGVVMSDIAQGEADLTKRLEVEQNDEIGALSHSFNVFVGSIHELVSQSMDSSRELDTLSSSARNNAEENNQAVQLQQSEISQVAVAVNELSSTSSEVASNASDTAGAAQNATEEGQSGITNAEENKRRMGRLTSQIDDATGVITQLDEQAQQITGILATIQGIAEQTNLLALNAAIEAARAGEQGRGFAVVADEVRTLSQRTHEATGEIQEMIDNLKQHSQSAVNIMQTSKNLTDETADSAAEVSQSLAVIAGALGDISERSQNIANASREQHAATEEISRIATAIQSASDDLAGNVAEAMNQSGQLHSLSTTIAGNLSRFRV
ncbi:methyl-accepting chemotaxis protein [Bacterioplanoides pacificum]|uniref:Methyl-accepting chemotaxis protein n=1 Tax=Bacterioplanoides pacificum TaxID=1171596 RepID=A0ABV7VYJ1_9GAMM